MEINLDKKQIRTFGLGLAVILTVFALWNYYKGHMTTSVILLTLGTTSASSAILFQPVIKPVYIVFMKISHVLGWINTRILLGLIFYVVITPIGFVIKIFGKDLLDRKIEPDKQSYWIKREKVHTEKSRYEKQF